MSEKRSQLNNEGLREKLDDATEMKEKVNSYNQHLLEVYENDQRAKQNLKASYLTEMKNNSAKAGLQRKQLSKDLHQAVRKNDQYEAQQRLDKARI